MRGLARAAPIAATALLAVGCTDTSQPQADAEQRIDALSALAVFDEQTTPGWAASDLTTRIGTVGGRNPTGSSTVARNWSPTTSDSNPELALSDLADRARLDGYSADGCPSPSDPDSTIMLQYAGDAEFRESILTLQLQSDGDIRIHAIAATGACTG